MDLISAKNSLKSGNYEWACFQSQQGSEKTLKSFLYLRGFRKILTHSIFELIKEVVNLEIEFERYKKEEAISTS